MAVGNGELVATVAEVALSRGRWRLVAGRVVGLWRRWLALVALGGRGGRRFWIAWRSSAYEGALEKALAMCWGYGVNLCRRVAPFVALFLIISYFLTAEDAESAEGEN